ncbi:MAG: hypothetical protein C0598_10995 [Marinilabiliales bacterium]|nr:MAG: hypothetical protein C0598_10995 [Marinilabiliales bacterium]
MKKYFPQTGQWTMIDWDNYLWRLTIKIDDADALNIYLSDLKLKDEDYLYIYGEAGRALSITSECKVSSLGTSVFKGSIINIIYKSKNQQLHFNISELGIIGSNGNRDFGDAAYCQIPINCPEGDDYQDIKNGIARILVKQGSSLFWCTGSLVNNTANDRKPYLLTANHCGKTSTEEDYSHWVFDFNFESPDCDIPLFEPDKNTVYGSKLLSNAPDEVGLYSDFKLLLLDDQVSSVTEKYFLGWDRSNNSSDKGVTLHHPQGDIKMISSYSQALISTEYYNKNENTEGKYWMVNWSETDSGHGATEGGSSGSPLLNEEGLLIGTLTGGDASCQFPDDPDWYGKFSYHWESNGSDSTKNLKYWLDPLDSNIEALNGVSNNPSELIAAFKTETPNITMGSGIEFINLSQGDIIEYNWYFEGGEPSSSNQKDPGIIRYYNSGEFDVRLIVKSATSTDETTLYNYINVASSVFPSVTQRYITIRTGSSPSEDIQISIISSNGKIIREYANPEIINESYIKLDLGSYRAGVYIIKLSIAGNTNSHKVILL